MGRKPKAKELGLDLIEARLEKATPGPWKAIKGYADARIVGDGWALAELATRCDQRDINDAKFIANARTDIPVLIAEIKRLRAFLAGRTQVEREEM